MQRLVEDLRDQSLKYFEVSFQQVRFLTKPTAFGKDISDCQNMTTSQSPFWTLREVFGFRTLVHISAQDRNQILRS
jgi:hypothetical protein